MTTPLPSSQPDETTDVPVVREASEPRPGGTIEAEALRTGLNAPRFGLKELFGFVALVAMGLVALQVLDPLVSAALILLGLCLFAHVAGNALGTRLRDGGPTPPQSRPSPPLQSGHYAPATRLGLHQRLGRAILICTALGAVVGAGGGGTALAMINWENVTLANMSLAAASSAVLGGLFGFWLGSFLQIAFQALAEAHKNADSK